MKKLFATGQMQLFKLFLILILFSFGTLSCGSFSSDDSNLVLVPPGPTPVTVGTTLQLTATSATVIWNVLGSAENGTIDPFGLYTAPSVLPADPNITIIGQDDFVTAFAFIELIE